MINKTNQEVKREMRLLTRKVTNKDTVRYTTNIDNGYDTLVYLNVYVNDNYSGAIIVASLDDSEIKEAEEVIRGLEKDFGAVREEEETITVTNADREKITIEGLITVEGRRTIYLRNEREYLLSWNGRYFNVMEIKNHSVNSIGWTDSETSNYLEKKYNMRY